MTRTRTLARRATLTAAMAGAVAFGAVALAPVASAAEVDGAYAVIDGQNESGPDAFLMDGTGRTPIFFCEVTPQELAAAQQVAADTALAEGSAQADEDAAEAAKKAAKEAREAADKAKAPKATREALEQAEKAAKDAAEAAHKATEAAKKAADKAAKELKDLVHKAHKRHNNCQVDPNSGSGRF